MGEYDDTSNVLREYAYLGDMPVGVLTKNEVLIDTGDGTSTGSWTASTEGEGYLGSNLRYAAAGSGESAWTWAPTVPEANTYHVFARLPVQAFSSATNAPY